MAETNEIYGVAQGAALTINIQLNDSNGDPITSYTGLEALSTTVWPGGSRAASFAAATSWTDHTAGTIAITITASQSAGLTPGRYQLQTTLTDTSGTPVVCYGCTLTVAASPGTDPAPATYCDYSWLTRFARGWLPAIADDDDEAGYALQLARARSWLEDLGHRHYRVASMVMVVGNQAFGPRRSGARSPWLQEQFDANKLMVTDQIRECVAKRALSYICEGLIGSGGSNDYAKLARVYHGQADYIATCLTLEIDTDTDGFADVVIDLSSTDPFYA